MRLTGEETLNELFESETFHELESYFVYNAPEKVNEIRNKKLKELYSDLENKSVLDGLNRLQELLEQGKVCYHPYGKAECEEDPQKGDVNFLYFPAMDKKKEDRPFILICPGGAYMNVWSFTEGYPTAARYNELGYDAFVLTYRTNGEHLFPKPMEDIAATLRYIKEHETLFSVSGDRYIVCGFSAGGNLTCQWGTQNNGYDAFSLPKPAALFPIYPVTAFGEFLNDELYMEMVKIVVGDGYLPEKLQRYEVLEHITEEYPPVFVAVCSDDDLVPPRSSELFKDKLEENQVPCLFEVGKNGGHGFGEGLHTDCAGWIERSIRFFESL